MLLAEKVKELPTHGQVVLANPANESRAALMALCKGIPYMVREIIPESHVYIFDIDKMPWGSPDGRS